MLLGVDSQNVGWIAPTPWNFLLRFPSGADGVRKSAERAHVFPWSSERSAKAFHTSRLPSLYSMDAGASHVPSCSRVALFLTGPRTSMSPLTSSWGVDQVEPLSLERDQ